MAQDTQREELAALKHFYDRSMQQLVKVDAYVREHHLGLGGEDIVGLLLEDAIRLRREHVAMFALLAEVIERLSTDDPYSNLASDVAKDTRKDMLEIFPNHPSIIQDS